MTNAEKEGGIQGEKEVRRTATNKELKGDVGLVAIIQHMRGRDTEHHQVIKQFHSLSLSVKLPANTTILHDNMFYQMLTDFAKKIWSLGIKSPHTLSRERIARAHHDIQIF